MPDPTPPATSHPPFDPMLALKVLLAHEVQFVVIGGFGGRLHGSPTVTNDLDVCYARDGKNVEALAAALVELRARLRGVSPEVPFTLDAKAVAMGDRFTFLTDAGSLDCMATVSGVSGFDELNRVAVDMDLDGITVRVASLDDLIRMKLAARRPKDLIEAEVLGALREEIDESGAAT